MTIIFFCLFTISWIAILVSVLINLSTHNSIKEAELRKLLLPIIDDDIARVWKSFFESYLFVYANSKMIPDEKEFLKFREAFIEMFNIMIGPSQCSSYANVFKGNDFLKLYIFHMFEKHFKQVFVEIIIDQTLLNDGKKTPNGKGE